jgi:hypothetical protein
MIDCVCMCVRACMHGYVCVWCVFVYVCISVFVVCVRVRVCLAAGWNYKETH